MMQKKRCKLVFLIDMDLKATNESNLLKVIFHIKNTHKIKNYCRNIYLK